MSETYEPKFKRSPAHTYWQHKAEKAEERCRELEDLAADMLGHIATMREVARLPQSGELARLCDRFEALSPRGAKGGGNG